MVRATAAQEQIRAFAISSGELVEECKRKHNTSPVVTAAVGRMLSAAAMMGMTMKGERDLMTLQVQGSGPLRGITVTADAYGHVKGFPNVGDVMLPPNQEGKLDVGGAIGPGILRVMKDIGLREPYVGTVELQTGEIAEDLTYYFAVSEQTPSSVGLGVLMNKDNTVAQAGGFIIQLMPEVADDVIETLEANIRELPSVTAMLSQGMSPEEVLGEVLKGLDVQIHETMACAFVCECSRERVERSLSSLGKEDMDEIIRDNEPIEVKCQFCNRAYHFSVEELKALRRAPEREAK